LGFGQRREAHHSVWWLAQLLSNIGSFSVSSMAITKEQFGYRLSLFMWIKSPATRQSRK
jgi:hypothetical protein